MMWRPLQRPLLYSVVVCLGLIVVLSNHLRSQGIWPTKPWQDLEEHQSSTDESSNTCRIWDHSNDFDPNNHEYDQAVPDGGAGVGDANIIGDAESCLSARPRLDKFRGDRASNGEFWSELKWGVAQKRCAVKMLGVEAQSSEITPFSSVPSKWPAKKVSQVSRTAVVIRSWDDFDYNHNQMAWMRAMITETALDSRGKMQVFLLVNVKDNELNISDPVVHQKKLQECVPPEFQDIAVLWNKGLLQSWYPLVKEHEPKLQIYQPLQVFAQHHQFDFYWQLEMDFRSTAHTYHALDNAATWAREQSRKNSWERNGQWYIPSLWNDSYATFSAAVSHDNANNSSIWGALPASDITPVGPKPPSVTSKGSEQWGVGEEADIITFMPMIDPVGSDWVYEDSVYNFKDGVNTPRRYAVIAVTRTSQQLLQIAHDAQSTKGLWLASEMMMPTMSLLHGLKAIYVPHRISFHHPISATQLNKTLNQGPPDNRAGRFPSDVSYTKHGYVDSLWSSTSFWWQLNRAQDIWEKYVNGSCIPPMLLHPVKDGAPYEWERFLGKGVFKDKPP